MSFANLKLHPLILKAIAECGYTKPTPIQERAIPEILAGHDLLACAQTGTGKTAAFMLPALQLLSAAAKPLRGPRILVLTPTRELAAQVTDATNKYGRCLDRVKSACILGGMPYGPQIRALSRPLDILVATPGRLMDHMHSNRVDLSSICMLVLDEADRMLDMGFFEDVSAIASSITVKHQTLLFSATLGQQVSKLAKNLLHAPRSISISQPRTCHENIKQRMHVCDDESHKQRLLSHWISDPGTNQVLVFTATKRAADRLARNLAKTGHGVAALHGDMNQRARNRSTQALRAGEVKVLVATDVAARGLDVSGISHVINYDLPRSPGDYIHRIGRTGRAGALGTAVSLVGHHEKSVLRRIENFTGQDVLSEVIRGLEPKKRSDKHSKSEHSQGRRTKRRGGRDSRDAGFADYKPVEVRQ